KPSLSWRVPRGHLCSHERGRPAMTTAVVPGEPGATSSESWSAVVGVATALERARSRPGGFMYPVLRWGGALLFVAVLCALAVTIATQSSAAFEHSGIGFFWSGSWNPASNHFGAGVLLVGTVVTTLVAMALVIPVGLGIATFLSELSPRWISSPLSSCIDV